MSLVSQLQAGFTRIAEEVNALRGENQVRKLASVTLGSNAATIDITGIPSGYSQLRFIVSARSTAPSSTVDVMRVRFNDDATAANYRAQYTQVTGTSAPTTGERLGTNINVFDLAAVPAAASPANWWGDALYEVLEYSRTDRHKAAYFRAMSFGLDATAGFNFRTGGFLWRNTAAIHKITFAMLTGNFLAGTKIELYGIK